MPFRGYQKFFSAFLLIPVVFLFVACCCLQADAAPQKKSNCSSCPQKEKSNHQTDCPHAKIKAISGVDSIALLASEFLSFWPTLVSSADFFSSGILQSAIFQYCDTSQQYSSLYSQNPILRI